MGSRAAARNAISREDFYRQKWASKIDFQDSHLNRDKIASNLSVPGIQGCHENALFKSFEMSPHLICL